MSVLVDDLRDELARGRAFLVVGAGVSMAATGGAEVAGWRGLLEHGIRHCAEVADVPPGWADVQRAALDLGDTESWLGVAEQVTRRLDEGEFRRWLRETVGALEPVDAGLLDALAALEVPLSTTNYDGLLERASDRRPVTWRDGAMVQRVVQGDEPGVVHLHGHWEDPKSVILGVRSYETVLSDGSAQAMLRALASLRSLVLVGFGAGLEDPNFTALREWMARTWSGSEYRHFRLVLEAEKSAAAEQHGDERVLPVVYGERYEDLGPFLRGLVRRSRPAPPRPARAAEPTLPAPRVWFGRDAIVESLVASVMDVEPLPVPILGPPGIGKSAVALACLHDDRVKERFGARRHWLRCDGSQSAAAVLTDIAAQAGVPVGAKDLAAATFRELSSDATLLVLDNAETPWTADIAGTEELLAQLAAVPGLALVCSFRGEERPLGPRWADSISVPPLASGPAEQLFLAHAGSRFAGDPDLADLLIDLDGMPIAIELLSRLAQPEPDLSGLRRRWERRRTGLLSAGPEPDRNLSVAVSFELSIDSPRLSPSARRLLSVLAHLPEGVASSDLEALFPGGDDAAAELRAGGLAFPDGDRVRVLKPIRDHVAAHHPAEAGDAGRASGHYVALAKRLGPKVGGTEGGEAATALRAEAGNLRWAVATALEGEDPAQGIDAALALAGPAQFTGLEIGTVLERAESRAEELRDDGRRARVLTRLGVLATRWSRLEDAADLLTRARALYRRTGDSNLEAEAIKLLGDVAIERFDYGTARGLYHEALPLLKQAGDSLGEANCTARLGELGIREDDLEAAARHFEEAQPIYERVGSDLGVTNCVSSLGRIALRRGDLGAAGEAFDRALTRYRQIGEASGVASCVQGLGDVSLAEGDPEAAHARYTEALPIFRQVGSALEEANCIQRLADIAVTSADLDAARGHYERALMLYAAINYSVWVGHCHHRLSQILEEPERSHHREAAREAWLSGEREDLVEQYL